MLVRCSKVVFDKLVAEKAVKQGFSGSMHATNFYDKEDNLIAWSSSSSWTDDIEYMINDNRTGNEITADLVTMIINTPH